MTKQQLQDLKWAMEEAQYHPGTMRGDDVELVIELINEYESLHYKRTDEDEAKVRIKATLALALDALSDLYGADVSVRIFTDHERIVDTEDGEFVGWGAP